MAAQRVGNALATGNAKGRQFPDRLRRRRIKPIDVEHLIGLGLSNRGAPVNGVAGEFHEPPSSDSTQAMNSGLTGGAH